MQVDFPPLQFPTPWPPPQWTANRWHAVPIVGGLLGRIHELLTGDRHRQILHDIERQIGDQLNGRPTDSDRWPEDSILRRVVDALARAVRKEKEFSLEHITLHPEDPIVLLVWGAYDDLTPFMFRRELESEFPLSLTCEEWQNAFSFQREWWSDNRTVSEIVEHCKALIVSKVADSVAI